MFPPGTYQLGPYDQMRLVDCSTDTLHDPLAVTTQDGVEFGIDIYVRFSADCTRQSVIDTLSSLSPADGGTTVTSQQLFDTYIRPALASAVAERERVQAETATAEARVQLAQRQGEAAGALEAARIQAEGRAQAARIDAIGAALARNPAYL